MNFEKRKLLFPFFLVCYEMCIYLSNDMYVPGLPNVMCDLKTSPGLAQATLSIWFLGSASLQLFLGPISDSFGRRVVLFTGGITFIISTIACALATNIETMLIARFIQGSSTCSMVVAGYATIHELYSSIRAIQILAFMGSVVVLSPALGPVIGAIIISVTTWPYTFWVLAIFAVIILGILFRIMPETNSKKIPLNMKRILIDYKELLFNKYFMTFASIFGLTLSSLFVWLVTSPFIITKTCSTSPLYFGVVQLFVCGALIIGNYITKYSIPRYKVAHIVMAGLLIALLGSVFLVVAAYLDTHIALIVVAMMLVALGTSIVFAPLSRLEIDMAVQPMGSKTAMSSAINNGLGAFVTLFVTLLNIETFVGASLVILLIIACAMLMYLCLDRTKLPHYEESK